MNALEKSLRLTIAAALNAPCDIDFERSAITAACDKIESGLPSPHRIGLEHNALLNSYFYLKSQNDALDTDAADRLDQKFKILIGQQQIRWQLDYFRQTRLSQLAEEGTVTARKKEAFGFDLVLKHGLGAEQDDASLLIDNDFFNRLSAVVDEAIGPAKIKQAATKYIDFFKNAPRPFRIVENPVAQQRAIQILKFSDYGRTLIGDRAKIHFVGLADSNQIRHDITRKKNAALGLYEIGQDKSYVDAQKRDKFDHANVLAHERAHRTNLVKAPGKSYTALREAHSIAAQYIVAGELIEAGFEPEKLAPALNHGFAVATIGLLTEAPAQFLRESSQSEHVRRRWELNDGERSLDDGIIQMLASTLPAISSSSPLLRQFDSIAAFHKSEPA